MIDPPDTQRVECKFTYKANLLGKTMNTKVPLHLFRFLFPAHLGLRILFCLCRISLKHVNDSLGQQIGKIRYHYFQN